MKRGQIAQSLSRGVFFLGLEKGAALASTLLYTAIMARWLGPTKYGIFTLAFSAVSLATAFTGNFELFLERYAAEYQAQGRTRTLRRAYETALGLKMAFGALAGLVLVLLAPAISRFYHVPELAMMLPLLVTFVVTDGLVTTGRSMLFGLQRFGWVSGLSLIFSIGKTAVVGLLWWYEQGLHSLAIAFSILTAVQALAMCLAAVVMVAREQRAGGAAEPAGEPGVVRPMFAYCLPLYGARLSFTSGQNLGKLVLGRVLDSEQLGYFTFAFQTVERFVEILHTVPNSLLPSLTHIVTREERERLGYVMGQAFRLIVVLACSLAFVLFVYAHEITIIVVSPLFAKAVPLLRVLALVPLVRTAQQPLNMLFQAMRRPGVVFALSLVKVGTEVLGYLLLLLPFGVMGACWANFSGALASFIVAMVLQRRMLPEGSPERIGVMVRVALLMAPVCLVTLLADRELGPTASLAVRIGLSVPAVLATFALGLVIAYDLEKLSGLSLPWPWLARARDALVNGAGQLTRVFENRRPA